ncbi:MAG: polysaccharide biosynthesis C-terminal domain-containing protein [Pseudomonadota bacterium]
MSATSSLLKLTLGYAPSLIIPRLIAFCIVLIFTRLLTPEQFGLYALVLSFGEMIYAAFVNWFAVGMTRHLPGRSAEHQAKLMSAAVIVFPVILCFAVPIAYFLSLTVDTELTHFLACLLVYVLGRSLQQFGLTLLRVKELQVSYVVCETLRPILALLCAVAFTFAFDKNYFVLSLSFFGVTLIFGGITSSYAVRQYGWASPDWAALKAMLRYAIPLIAVFTLSAIIAMTDRLMLNELSGIAAVGIYAAAFALAKPPLDMIFNAVNLGGFAKLIAIYNSDGSEKALQFLQKKLSFVLALALPAAVGITLFAQTITQLLLGEAYREQGQEILSWIAIAAVLAGLKHFIFDQIFHLTEKTWLQSVTLIPAVVCNIVMNFILIPELGPQGAALSTACAYGAALCGSIYLSAQYLPFQLPYKDMGRIVLATCTMTILLLFWPSDPAALSFVLAVILGITVYGVCLYLVGFQKSFS